MFFKTIICLVFIVLAIFTFLISGCKGDEEMIQESLAPDLNVIMITYI